MRRALTLGKRAILILVATAASCPITKQEAVCVRAVSFSEALVLCAGL